jgi:deoxyribonuclease V
MIAFLDVDYRDAGALAAVVVADDWTAPEPTYELTEPISTVAEYVPGEFYRRELPCLLAVLSRCPTTPDILVVDGYVWLGEGRPGLGKKLHEALNEKIPVVGVAKTRFKSAAGVASPVYRAGSQQALWVTTVGMDHDTAIQAIQKMHGAYRLPTLLKRVDLLCRNAQTV